MAVIDCKLNAGMLGISTSIKIVLPSMRSGCNDTDFSSFYRRDKKFPAVWLLHGGSGSSSDLLYHMPLPELADRFRVAFIVPDAQNSCFRDMVYGQKWMTYITEKLPPYVYANYPISSAREDNLITGFSMGGYGSLQLALQKPEKYGAAAPMAIGNKAVYKYAQKLLDDNFDAQLYAVYGENREGLSESDADCYYLVRSAEKEAKKIRYLLCAGTQDFTYEDTKLMCQTMNTEGFKVDFIENTFAHEDASWIEFMPRILKWFLNKEK